jgi:hypothetical protein
MPLLSALLAGLASPLEADGLRGDAFGVFVEAEDPDRMAWAGLNSDLGPPGDEPSDHVIVAPGSAATVLIQFGEKSLARRTGVALLAAIVLDTNGNLVADGTAMSLRAGDGASVSPTGNGIAARRVPAGEVAGNFHAWAETAGQGHPLRQSPRVTYRVVPALPDQGADLAEPSARLQIEDVVSFEAELDGQADRPDLLDGMSAQIVLAHPDGAHSVVPGMWIGGQLHARLLNRDIAGTARARLYLPYAASSEVSVDVPPITTSGPLHVAAAILPEIRATRLHLGPITTDAGHLIHDGSLVEVSVTDAAGHEFQRSAWTLNGLAEITVPTDELPLSIAVATPGGVLSQLISEAEVAR